MRVPEDFLKWDIVYIGSRNEEQGKMLPKN